MNRKWRVIIPAVVALLAISTIGATEARSQHARGYHHGPAYGRSYSYGRPGYAAPRHGYGYSYRYGAPRSTYGGSYYGGNYGPRGSYGYSSGYGPYYGSSFYYNGPGYGYSFYNGYCR
jgi:hypothetical protein